MEGQQPHAALSKDTMMVGVEIQQQHGCREGRRASSSVEGVKYYTRKLQAVLLKKYGQHTHIFNNCVNTSVCFTLNYQMENKMQTKAYVYYCYNRSSSCCNC